MSTARQTTKNPLWAGGAVNQIERGEDRLNKNKYYCLIDKNVTRVIYASTSPSACQRAYVESVKNGVDCKISCVDGLGTYQN